MPVFIPDRDSCANPSVVSWLVMSARWMFLTSCLTMRSGRLAWGDADGNGAGGGAGRDGGAPLALEYDEVPALVAVDGDDLGEAVGLDVGEEGLVQPRVDPDVRTDDELGGVDMEDPVRVVGGEPDTGQLVAGVLAAGGSIALPAQVRQPRPSRVRRRARPRCWVRGCALRRLPGDAGLERWSRRDAPRPRLRARSLRQRENSSAGRVPIRRSMLAPGSACHDRACDRIRDRLAARHHRAHDADRASARALARGRPARRGSR